MRDYDDGDPDEEDPVVDPLWTATVLCTFMEAYAVLMTLICRWACRLLSWSGSQLSPYGSPDVLEEEAIEQRLVDPHVEGSRGGTSAPATVLVLRGGVQSGG